MSYLVSKISSHNRCRYISQSPPPLCRHIVLVMFHKIVKLLLSPSLHIYRHIILIVFHKIVRLLKQINTPCKVKTKSHIGLNFDSNIISNDQLFSR